MDNDKEARDAAANRLPSENDVDAPPRARKGDENPTVPVPDFVRRALELGFASFFTTEQTIRRAVGETIPKDWIDFVSAQSDRTRKEMTDAIVSEAARSIERIDLMDTLDGLFSGRTIEINAKIRLAPRDDEPPLDTEPPVHNKKGS